MKYAFNVGDVILVANIHSKVLAMPNNNTLACDSSDGCLGCPTEQNQGTCYTLMRLHDGTKWHWHIDNEKYASLIKKGKLCNCIECFGEHSEICKQQTA